MNKIPLTVNGAERLRVELHQLKTVDRPNVIAAIAEARSHGDLSENAEYDAAREEQGLVESRIAEIEDILMNAELIKGGSKTKVSLGSIVELKTGKKSVTYTVVGPVEANPLEGKISNESPIGEALFGKKVGDSATITTPKGDVTYEIVTIS